jgi:hypothetical protein
MNSKLEQVRETVEQQATNTLEMYMAMLHLYAEEKAVQFILESRQASKVSKVETAIPTFKPSEPKKPKKLTLKEQLRLIKRDIFEEMLNDLVECYYFDTKLHIVSISIEKNVFISFENGNIKKQSRLELEKIIQEAYENILCSQIELYVENEIVNSPANVFKKVKDNYTKKFIADCKSINFENLENLAESRFSKTKIPKSISEKTDEKENSTPINKSNSNYQKILKESSKTLGIHSNTSSFALTEINLSGKNLRHLKILKEGSKEYRIVLCKDNKFAN